MPKLLRPYFLIVLVILNIIYVGKIYGQNVEVQVPDIPQNDFNAVMNWIKVKTTSVRLPFCWRDSYGRGAGVVRSVCASNLEKNGALCYPKCNNGYKGVGPVCWQSCPSGYRDDGAFCAKPSSYGRGSGYALWSKSKCERENKQGCEKWGALYYPKCKANFHNVACCVCSPNCPPGFGADIGVSCTKKSYGRGAGVVLQCPSGYIPDETGGPVGLCYPKCKTDFHGVGPVCWQNCVAPSTDCGAGCAMTKLDCGTTVTNQVLAPIFLAANILTFGMANSGRAVAEGTAGAVKVGTKFYVASNNVAKYGLKLVNLMQSVDQVGTTVVEKIINAKTGTFIKQVLTTIKVTKATIQAEKDYSTAFASDFTNQTSPQINAEIDRRFTNSITRDYIKSEWGKIQLKEMAAANGWSIAQDALTVLSIVDITGITGVVSAFAHPKCQERVDFPNLTGHY